MAARRKRSAIPAPMVEMTARGLSPLSAADEELLAQFKPGQMFDLVPRDKDRSGPQLRLYFAVLGKVCAATGMWPKADILHDFLMRHCGTYGIIAGMLRAYPDLAAHAKIARAYNKARRRAA